MSGARTKIFALSIGIVMTPKLKLKLYFKPTLIQVSNQEYQVDVYVGEDFAFSLNECYNDIEEAQQAVKNYLMERL